jgi:5'-nucleotidase
MGKKARFCAALLALGGLGLAAGSLPACSSTKDTVERPCPPGQACSVSLTLLHTADIHSRLFPYEQIITQVDATAGLGTLNAVSNIGGVARMSYVLNRERARAGRVLHLDSGDCFQGAPIFNFFAGEPEVRTMSALGVDAAALGNHEFDRGAENVARQFQRWSNFPLLAANYKFEQTTQDVPNFGRVGTVARPFVVLNTGGLKVAAIGMANLSSITSIFDQPNKLGVMPLNTVEVAQTYIDLLRPYVDLVVMVTHLGLDVDQRMVRGTTGIDVVLGGHNHVVINPPQELRDCSADPNNPGFVWAVDPNAKVDPEALPPDGPDRDPVRHPFAIKRPCRPRRVLIAHSGAFSKYVGRLDLVLSNDRNLVSPTGDPNDYDDVNGFEVQSSQYQAFPIDDRTPEDPVLVEMLQPYRRSLDRAADLEILVGFSPSGSRRISTTGGDSPLGNLVGNAIWLRLGIQTDFSLTNSTGIRADLNPGPVTIEQMFNIFPFDNSITKMQLSGLEVQELFDFAARRTANRGCASQIQIAGARVRFNCSGCDRVNISCANDADCQSAVPRRDACDLATNRCIVRCDSDEVCRQSIGGTCDQVKRVCVVEACAEQVYIGHSDRRCVDDKACNPPGADGPALPGICDKTGGKPDGLCLSLISQTNLYELATSNYLAGGGSGFRVLQRNTTQVDTKVQQRDALIDYLRQGKPCGYNPTVNQTPDGLKACSADPDCGDPGQVCSCPGHTEEVGSPVTCASRGACESGAGRCVLAACRDQVAQFHAKRCAGAPDQLACRTPIRACELAGEECKILSCIDKTIGNLSDNRVELVGK